MLLTDRLIRRYFCLYPLGSITQLVNSSCSKRKLSLVPWDRTFSDNSWRVHAQPTPPDNDQAATEGHVALSMAIYVLN